MAWAAKLRKELLGQKRPVRLHSLCSGMGTEQHAIEESRGNGISETWNARGLRSVQETFPQTNLLAGGRAGPAAGGGTLEAHHPAHNRHQGHSREASPSQFCSGVP